MKRTIITFGLIALVAGLFGFSAPAQASSLLEPIGAVGNFLDDTGITTEVKARLAAEDGLDSSNIHVTTNDGVVRLDGSVGSSAQSGMAERVVAGQSNVKGVVNNLKVR